MHPIQLQDELKSELFLNIAEIPEKKLIDLYKKTIKILCSKNNVKFS